MKEAVTLLLKRYSQIEVNAHGLHGPIALEDGTEERAKRVVLHFENQLEVNEAIGFARGIASAKSNITHAKSKYKSGSNELLMTWSLNMVKRKNKQFILLLHYF